MDIIFPMMKVKIQVYIIKNYSDSNLQESRYS